MGLLRERRMKGEACPDWIFWISSGGLTVVPRRFREMLEAPFSSFSTWHIKSHLPSPGWCTSTLLLPLQETAFFSYCMTKAFLRGREQEKRETRQEGKTYVKNHRDFCRGKGCFYWGFRPFYGIARQKLFKRTFLIIKGPKMGDSTFSSATSLVACSVVGIKSGRGQKYPILSLERE